MILVTGAAGKTGRAVLQALQKRSAAVCAFVHREPQAELVKQLGAQEVFWGNLGEYPRVAQAVQGVRAIYFICPNVNPDEAMIGRLLIAAAQSAGVEHFVYHSVLHPQTEGMPHHWQKLRVEEALFEAGLPFTILQPAAYMQNLLAYWESIVGSGVYPVPYPPETRLSLVDLEDVAQAAAQVLTEPGHTGATYELVGTVALSQLEVAESLSKSLGRPVRVETTPLDAWEQSASAAGLGEYARDALKNMFNYYARFGFTGNPNVLGWLLGRPPTSFETFINRSIKDMPYS
jgi:uncharacterized protein YbjT (DUF2867 family)